MPPAKQRRRGKTSTIPAQHCPACLGPFNRASHITGRHKPQPGDLNVCAYCAAVAIFDDGLMLRLLRDDEAGSLAAVDPRAWQDVLQLRRLIAADPLPSHDTKTRH